MLFGPSLCRTLTDKFKRILRLHRTRHSYDKKKLLTYDKKLALQRIGRINRRDQVFADFVCKRVSVSKTRKQNAMDPALPTEEISVTSFSATPKGSGRKQPQRYLLQWKYRC